MIERKKKRKKELDGRTDKRTDILMTSTFNKYGDALTVRAHLRWLLALGRTYVDLKEVRTNDNFLS